MALNSTTFTLVPNTYDGRQRLSDPSGTYEPTVPTLQPVTALSISDTTHNEQTLTWQHDEGDGIQGYIIDIWVAEQDTTWRFLQTVYIPTKTYTSTGLPPSRYIRYRVAAGIDGTPIQISEWKEVDGSTLANPNAGSGDGTDLLSLTFFTNFEGLAHNSYMNQNMPSRFEACDNFTVDANKGGVGGPGTKCGHTFIQGNNSTTGWGDWGYYLKGLPRPIHGAEVWWRQAIFWPTNANTNHGSGGGLKQMRMERNTISGLNRGATELLLMSGGAHDKEQKISVEYVGEDSFIDEDGYPTSGYFMGPPGLVFGRWNFIEMYCKFHEDKTIGEIASWIDGVPAGRANSYTMGDTSEWNWGYYFGTYWNDYEFRSDYQEQWYDQIAIAQQGPVYGGGTANDMQYLDTDINGYPFIGTAINTDDLT
jgi:hypothetical protein